MLIPLQELDFIFMKSLVKIKFILFFIKFKNWRNSHPNSSSVGDCGAMDMSDLYLGEWMSFKCENKFNNMVCAKYSSNSTNCFFEYQKTPTLVF